MIYELNERRRPVSYTIRLTHHWDGTIEVFVKDVAGDDRSRASVGYALLRGAQSFNVFPSGADALYRIALRRVDALISAEEGTPELAELSELASAVAEYESFRFPQKTDP